MGLGVYRGGGVVLRGGGAHYESRTSHHRYFGVYVTSKNAAARTILGNGLPSERHGGCAL